MQKIVGDHTVWGTIQLKDSKVAHKVALKTLDITIQQSNNSRGVGC